MNDYILDDLQALCLCCGCANQPSIEALAIELLRPLVDEVYTDAIGNVIGWRRVNDPQAKTVMLEAHMDEIGFLVTHIDGDGFVHVAPAGGIDMRVLAAQPVLVHGKKQYPGVFCSVPPHLSGDDKKLPAIEERGIDVGLSANEARANIPLGSRVTFTPNFIPLTNDLVCSKSLDNRSGMAAIFHCLRQLETRDVNIAVAFCVQEELGCRGAAVATRQIQPDVAIVTDVSFAKTHDKQDWQCADLAGGVMIGMSPVLHTPTADKLFTLAKKHDITYQTEIMASTTGTDADQISITGTGVPCALLSIPLRYMHTPSEIISGYDVLMTANLMARFIEEGIGE